MWGLVVHFRGRKCEQTLGPPAVLCTGMETGSALQRATSNLEMLLDEVSADWRAILDRDQVQLRFAKGDDAGHVGGREIVLSLDDFAAFRHSQERPGAAQRWALATLKEEIIHYLAGRLAFDRSLAWRRAVASDLRGENRYRDQLLAAQRNADSAPDHIKPTLAEYAADESWLARIAYRVLRRSVIAEEMLPDLLLCRDFLARKYSPRVVGDRMRRAFPAAYPLALDFEAQVAALAGMPTANR